MLPFQVCCSWAARFAEAKDNLLSANDSTPTTIGPKSFFYSARSALLYAFRSACKAAGGGNCGEPISYFFKVRRALHPLPFYRWPHPFRFLNRRLRFATFSFRCGVMPKIKTYTGKAIECSDFFPRNAYWTVNEAPPVSSAGEVKVSYRSQPPPSSSFDAAS